MYAEIPSLGRGASTKILADCTVYTGGVGDEFSGIGPVINLKNRDAKSVDQCGNKCARLINPWAVPGQAPSLGGGCGIFGRNPLGCPAGKDTKPPECGHDQAPTGSRDIPGLNSNPDPEILEKKIPGFFEIYHIKENNDFKDFY